MENDILKKLIGLKLKVRFDNEEYYVVVKEIIDKDKFFAISEEPIQSVIRGKKGEVFFQIEDDLYTFNALLWTPSSDRVVIQKITDITKNKRKTERVEVGEIPVNIIETSILEKRIVDGIMLDLNENGAQIWTKEPLRKNLKLKLSFKIRGKDLEIPFEIRSVNMKGSTYCYGVKFLEMTENDKKIINKFLKKLEGKTEISDEIEKIKVEELLKDFEKKE